MLKKCLKYDLRYNWPLFRILLPSLLGIAVLVGISIRTLMGNNNNFFISFPAGAVTFVGTLGFVIVPFVTTLFICIRYYKDFFSDAGYLTFTLPVSREKLFFSKVLSAFIWELCAAVCIILGIIIVLLIVPIRSSLVGEFGQTVQVTSSLFAKVVEECSEGIRMVWGEIGAWMIVYVLELILAFPLSVLISLLFIYFCITIASMIAKKNKVIVAIVIYYGTTWVISILTTICTTFGIGGITSMVTAFRNVFEGKETSLLLLALCGAIGLVILAIIATVLWLVSLHSIERKLNLA